MNPSRPSIQLSADIIDQVPTKPLDDVTTLMSPESSQTPDVAEKQDSPHKYKTFHVLAWLNAMLCALRLLCCIKWFIQHIYFQNSATKSRVNNRMRREQPDWPQSDLQPVVSGVKDVVGGHRSTAFALQPTRSQHLGDGWRQTQLEVICRSHVGANPFRGQLKILS